MHIVPSPGNDVDRRSCVEIDHLLGFAAHPAGFTHDDTYRTRDPTPVVTIILDRRDRMRVETRRPFRRASPTRRVRRSCWRLKTSAPTRDREMEAATYRATAIDAGASGSHAMPASITIRREINSGCRAATRNAATPPCDCPTSNTGSLAIDSIVATASQINSARANDARRFEFSQSHAAVSRHSCAAPARS